MTHLPLRPLDISPEAEHAYAEWLASLASKLADPERDRSELVRDVLTEIYIPSLEPGVDTSRLPAASQAIIASLDPRGSTMEPEYYRDMNPDLYYPRKPLIWLWQMFDRSVLGGTFTSAYNCDDSWRHMCSKRLERTSRHSISWRCRSGTI